ncbi:MAG: ParB N-terminal domain-containing protein [Planctomycetes bacterium]|nr:ParB N-terminal domain-containing protein [Planctomycetota bacterium]
MEIVRRPLDSIIPDPLNARAHPEANLDAIVGSLSRFGQAEPLVVQKCSSRLIAGHGRLMAMRKLRWTECDVVELDVDDRTAKALGIALNRTAELATWDEKVLATLLAELKEDGDLDGIGFSDADVDQLLADLALNEPHEVEDPGEQEPPENPVTRLGDLWILGDHRLLCGDSTKAEDMQRLMGTDVAMLCASDPPYLVDYDGTNHPSEHHAKAGREAGEGKLLGNKHWDAYVDPKTSVAFFADYLRIALSHCDERAPVYQWHATRRQALVEQAWEMNGLLVHQTIVWSKTRGVLTRSHFLWKHEPAFYGWRKGMQPERDRRPPPSETTIWELGSESDGIHPCLHPDALVLTDAGYRPIRTISVGDRVYAADGRFHPVAGVSSHIYRSPELIKIVAKRGNQATLASDNHPFLVLRPERKSTRIASWTVSWMRADEIQVGDYTMTPVMAEPEEDPLPERDEEYWFLFGLYLAQGSLQSAGHGDRNYPVFAINKKRQDLVDRIRRRWSSVGEYDGNDYGAFSYGLTVMAFDAAAGAEFQRLGGRRAHAKKPAPVVLQLPRSKRLAVLQGWLNGDGCRVHDRTYWQGKTASPDLASLMALIGESAGYKANVFRYEPPEVLGSIQGRQFKSQRPEYHLYFYERGVGGPNARFTHVEHEGRTYTLRYVKSVERVPYEGEVCNLSVEGSPTFQTAVGMSHNTQKPVAIFERPIEWHTRPGEVVLEPFSGSGTQIIAAEKLARRCRAMELSPPFVDAAVQRWQKATGKKAVLEGDGRSFDEIAAERVKEPAS